MPARRSWPRATSPTARSLTFALRLPDDALPNIATPHGRIGWELRARVDRAGPDPTVDRPIELLRSYTAPDRERWPSG